MEVLKQDEFTYLSQFLTRCSLWLFSKTCKYINSLIQVRKIFLDLKYSNRLVNVNKTADHCVTNRRKCSLQWNNNFGELYNLGEWIYLESMVIHDMILCSKSIKFIKCNINTATVYCKTLIIYNSLNVDINGYHVETLILDKSTLKNAINAKQVIIIGPYNKPVTIPIHHDTKQITNLDNSVTLCY
jgi:hypothetical protein